MQVNSLSNKLKLLDWGTAQLVTCGNFYSPDCVKSECSLCSNHINPINFDSTHSIVGYASEKNKDIEAVHYLCIRCSRHCNICKNH